jgi:hypothetical protein
MQLDPYMLNTFRRRIANPMYWRRTHGILQPYNRYQLSTPEALLWAKFSSLNSAYRHVHYNKDASVWYLLPRAQR